MVTAILFWFIFHHYDDQEEEMNKLDVLEEKWGAKGGEESDEETASARNAQQPHPEEKL